MLCETELLLATDSTRSHDRRAYFGLEPTVILFVIITSVFALIGFIAYISYFANIALVSRLLYAGLLVGLFCCCLSYQVSRFGASVRELGRPRIDDADLKYLFEANAPTIAILIPSYREERRVVVMTLLSAALARYSNRRIVLLVDDPPSDGASLDRTVGAVDDVRGLLDVPIWQFRAAAAHWDDRRLSGTFAPGAEATQLAIHYRFAAQWLRELATTLGRDVASSFAHVDSFFIDEIVLSLAHFYERHAADLEGQDLDMAAVQLEYGRLASLFCTDITAFERKRFSNLSHAPNKAMNLNSYIGLLGGRFVYAEREGGRSIEPAGFDHCDLVVEATDYVLTLDADSVVRHNYMVELINILEHNPCLGVAQTPYLTFPKSTAPVERIAGATTDVQYLVHQGATFFNASYWVGANALIRSAALRAIGREQGEAGQVHKVFIQDETVIEDTGSTIDLLEAGWSVHNHFAPLAYSATPADFGALAIQRKRWSNGGLIIFPMLLRQYFGHNRRLARLIELGLRSNYLLSPAIGNTAVFLLMIWASVDGRTLLWTPLIMLPYFTLYGMDLRRLGYRFRDVFAVCALNLVLLPVGFAGVGASIRQMVTRRKGSFSRTPKIANRTFVPPPYFLFNVAMAMLMLGYVLQGISAGDYPGIIIPLINVCLYAYGLHYFVGIGNGFSDVALVIGAALRSGRRRVFNGRAIKGSSVSRGAATARRRALGPAMFFLAIMIPWQVSPTLLQGDLARGASASRAKPAGDAVMSRPHEERVLRRARVLR